jgi:hypothetical protein
MIWQELPSELKNIVESSLEPEALFETLLSALGDFLLSVDTPPSNQRL